MIILSLDTSSLVSSVAVMSEERLLAEVTVETRLTHSETLVVHIERALELSGIKKNELGAVAVSIGPGSFTGLRIGLAAAKAICYALKIPIVGIPTLSALAARYYASNALVCPIMDAQKGCVYRSFYRLAADGLQEEKGLAVVSLEELFGECEAIDMSVVILGDLVGKKLRKMENLPKNIVLAPHTLAMPRAAEVALLALKNLEQGKEDNIMTLEPLYIRRSEAEVLWEERQRKAMKNV